MSVCMCPGLFYPRLSTPTYIMRGSGIYRAGSLILELVSCLKVCVLFGFVCLLCLLCVRRTTPMTVCRAIGNRLSCFRSAIKKAPGPMWLADRCHRLWKGRTFLHLISCSLSLPTLRDVFSLQNVMCSHRITI